MPAAVSGPQCHTDRVDNITFGKYLDISFVSNMGFINTFWYFFNNPEKIVSVRLIDNAKCRARYGGKRFVECCKYFEMNQQLLQEYVYAARIGFFLENLWLAVS